MCTIYCSQLISPPLFLASKVQSHEQIYKAVFSHNQDKPSICWSSLNCGKRWSVALPWRSGRIDSFVDGAGEPWITDCQWLSPFSTGDQGKPLGLYGNGRFLHMFLYIPNRSDCYYFLVCFITFCLAHQLMKELFPAEWLPSSKTVIFFRGERRSILSSSPSRTRPWHNRNSTGWTGGAHLDTYATEEPFSLLL